jgi:hypothetical protein
MPDSRKGLNLCSIFPLLEEESPDDFSLVGEDSKDELEKRQEFQFFRMLSFGWLMLIVTGYKNTQSSNS